MKVGLIILLAGDSWLSRPLTSLLNLLPTKCIVATSSYFIARGVRACFGASPRCAIEILFDVHRRLVPFFPERGFHQPDECVGGES